MQSASGSLSRRNLLSGKDPPLFCFVATHPKLSMLAPHLCPADSHDVGLCLARPTRDEHSCKQELAKTGPSPLQYDRWKQVCFESAAQVKCPRPDPPELVSATQGLLAATAVWHWEVCHRARRDKVARPGPVKSPCKTATHEANCEHHCTLSRASTMYIAASYWPNLISVLTW